MSGRPTLGPYESYPDVFIRRGRREDDASTSRPKLTCELRSTDAGTLKDVRKTFIRAQRRSSSQRHDQMRRTMDDPCRVGNLKNDVVAILRKLETAVIFAQFEPCLVNQFITSTLLVTVTLFFG